MWVPTTPPPGVLTELGQGSNPGPSHWCHESGWQGLQGLQEGFGWVHQVGVHVGQYLFNLLLALPAEKTW